MKGFDHAALARTLEKLPTCFCVQGLTRSILGKEIEVIGIGQGKRTVLYVGAHHGSEYITSAVLADFLNDIGARCERGGTICGVSIAFLLSAWRFEVIPMLNPDGVEYALHGVAEGNPLYSRVTAMNERENAADFTHWNANARGVDLNHNYRTGFNEYKNMERMAGILNGAPSKYSGEYPESEPESAALARYIRKNAENIKGILTLHTQGEEIFCGKKEERDQKTASVGRLLSRALGYPIAEPEGSAAFGGLTDWCLAEMKIPTFTLECGRGKNPLPFSDRTKIYERVRNALFSFPLWL